MNTEEIQLMRNQIRAAEALTLVEMVIAMAIMALVFAAVLPQFRAIQNSWASKQAAAETLQNGRILIDHLNRNLSKAVRITAVSGSAETNGYIEFQDNVANNLRYDIAANNYVEFGTVGSLSDLAGPVSQLQFTCYDGNDFDTPITDTTAIRTVKVEATLVDTDGRVPDKTFSTWAYLRTNYQDDDTGTGGYDITKACEPWLEFDNVQGVEPALCQIDQTHYLCAYSGDLDDGWVVVLTVDTGDWTVTKGTPFEFDTDNGSTPALCQIDASHYLCAYTGPGVDGWATVLTVDTGTWTITKETPFEYDTSNGETPALCRIDSTHYLCAYEGVGGDGFANILKVDTGTWNISKGTALEYNTSTGATPALAMIDATHYLCAYQGPQSDGWAMVLTVDTGTLTITSETQFEYDTTTAKEPALAKIDETHYLCTYLTNGDAGLVTVLTVDTGTWTITDQTPFEYDTVGMTAALSNIDNTHCLCVYMGPFSDGLSVVLTVDTGTWAVSKETPFEYDTADGASPALAKIDDNHYLCAYTSSSDRGWAGVLTFRPELLP